MSIIKYSQVQVAQLACHRKRLVYCIPKINEIDYCNSILRVKIFHDLLNRWQIQRRNHVLDCRLRWLLIISIYNSFPAFGERLEWANGWDRWGPHQWLCKWKNYSAGLGISVVTWVAARVAFDSNRCLRRQDQRIVLRPMSSQLSRVYSIDVIYWSQFVPGFRARNNIRLPTKLGISVLPSNGDEGFQKQPWIRLAVSLLDSLGLILNSSVLDRTKRELIESSDVNWFHC